MGKQLEKYGPEIEQIGDQEKIIKIQNSNPNETIDIMFDINRENFYFPFTLELSEIPKLLNINNTGVNSETCLSEVFCTQDFKKIICSPRTNTIFFNFLNSVNFKSISTINFKLSPFQEVTFKYKVEEQKSMILLHKQIKRTKNRICAMIFLFCVSYIATWSSLIIYAA